MVKPKEYILKNDQLEIGILDFGAIISKLIVRNPDGNPVEVTLGYDTPEEYLTDQNAFGATIGRCADRIAHGKFELNGTPYELARNNGPHHIHGGPQNFSKRMWNIRQESPEKLVATRLSPDGEEGYPGNLTVQITFSVENGDFKIEYHAVSDADTVCSLTNHAYFNLRGSGDILDHLFQSDAKECCLTDETILPKEKTSVDNTLFDFKKAVELGRFRDTSDPQISGGYNHFYFVDGDGLRRAASLYCPENGLNMDVFTTCEGFMLYTANALDVVGRNGCNYHDYGAVCIETGTVPNAVNAPVCRTAILPAGTPYAETTIYRFSNNRHLCL